jgi:hypothetical protein
MTSAELGETVTIDMGIDLLGFVSLYNIQLLTAMGDGSWLDGVLTVGTAILEASFFVAIPIIIALLIAADAAMMSFAGMGWALALYGLAVIAITTLLTIIFLHFTVRVWNGEHTHGVAWGLYLIMLVEFIIYLVGFEEITEIIAGSIMARATLKFGSKAMETATKAMRTGKYFLMLMGAFLIGMIFYHLIMSA